MIEKNIYDKITEILTEPFKNKEIKPKIFKSFRGDTVINMPKKFEMDHGSSYIFKCKENIKKCTFTGDVVISKDKVIKIKNEIDESGCRIIVSHQHEGIHTHFTCENKAYDDTLKIIKLLKEY